MTKAVLHIGSAQTGTSALQSALAKSYAANLDRGMCYPVAEAECHHLLFFAAKLPPAQWPRQFFNYSSDRLKREVAAYLRYTHRDDLAWLAQHWGITLTQDPPDTPPELDEPLAAAEHCAVREVFEVDEAAVLKYETYVLDGLLSSVWQQRRKDAVSGTQAKQAAQ